MHTWRRWVVDAPARRRSSRAARRGLPLLQLLGGLALVAAEIGDQRDHAGVDARHQPIGFLSFVVAHQQPAAAAGDIGHVGAPLLEDQIEAGTEPIPAFGAPRRTRCGRRFRERWWRQSASCSSRTREQTTAFNPELAHASRAHAVDELIQQEEEDPVGRVLHLLLPTASALTL
jgi:hypothetical protein